MSSKPRDRTPQNADDSRSAKSEPNAGGIPSSVFSRYEDLVFLGEGGMARVYRAYDPSLGRRVALKLIRGDDPSMVRRLLQGARSQGRIETVFR